MAPTATETVTRTVNRRVRRSELDARNVPAASLVPGEEPGEGSAEIVAPVYDLPVMPPVDSVLLEILRSEVAQYLQAIRAAIGRADDGLRVDDALLRAVHTLHGAIAMVDIPLLIQLLSPLESLLKRLRAAGKPLTSEGVSLLAQAADAVDHVMGLFDVADPKLPDLSRLIARLIELRDGEPEPQVAHVVFDPRADELDSTESDAESAATVDADDHPLPEAETTAAAAPEDDDALSAELLAALDAFEPVDADAESVADPATEAGVAAPGEAADVAIATDADAAGPGLESQPD